MCRVSHYSNRIDYRRSHTQYIYVALESNLLVTYFRYNVSAYRYDPANCIAIYKIGRTCNFISVFVLPEKHSLSAYRESLIFAMPKSHHS